MKDIEPSEPPEMDKDRDYDPERAEERAREMAEQEGIAYQPVGEPRQDIQNLWEDMIEPEFQPGTELYKWQRHFKAALSRIIPTTQLKRKDVPRFLAYFDCIYIELKIMGKDMPMHLYDSFRMLLEAMLLKSVGGFERKMQAGVVSEGREEEEEKGLLSRLFGG